MENNILITKKDEAIKLCNKNLELINEYTSKENEIDNYYISKLCNFLKDRNELFKKICSVESYDINLNGAVGVGKTTLISAILDLIGEDNEPLLTTSVGRTTPCETIIEFTDSDKSSIEVFPLEYTQFKNNLKKYINDNLSSTNSNVDNKEKEDLSIECKRIIENMLGITLMKKENKRLAKDKEGKIDQKYLKTTKQIILEKFTCDKNDISEDELKKVVFNEMIKEIKYEERTICEYEFDNSEFKEILEDINFGKNKDCPYPNKIVIKLTKTSLPSYVNTIKDTRGLDGDTYYRADIINSICENYNTINLMCDKLDNIGNDSNTIGILKTAFSKDKYNLLDRIAFIGLARANELDKVADADDVDEAIFIKSEEAYTKIKENNISLNKENILIFDALYCIQDKDKNKKNISCFWSKIEEILINMYERYIELIKKDNKYIKILNENKLPENISQKLDCILNTYCQEFINKEYNFKFVNLIIQDFCGAHWKSQKAIITRNGGLDDDNYNVYKKFSEIGIDEFKKYNIEIRISKLNALIKHEFNRDLNVSKEDSNMYSTCINILEFYLDDLQIRYSDKIEKFYYDQLCNVFDNNLWNKLDKIEGKDFKKNVKKEIKNHLIANPITSGEELLKQFDKNIIDLFTLE